MPPTMGAVEADRAMDMAKDSWSACNISRQIEKEHDKIENEILYNKTFANQS